MMNTATAKRRWFQCRLRTVLLLFLLVAVGLGGWQYWRQTRHMWRLHWAIRECPFASLEEDMIWRKLAWNREAWECGVIRYLGGHIPALGAPNEFWKDGRASIVWSERFTDEKGKAHNVHLFILGGKSKRGPLLCMLADDQRNAKMWRSIGEYNYELASASIVRGVPPILQIEWRHWFSGGEIREQYEIADHSFNLVDKMISEQIGFPDAADDDGSSSGTK